MMKKSLIPIMLAVLALGNQARADGREESPLDSYVPLANPVVETGSFFEELFRSPMSLLAPTRSDLGKALAFHTPVKSQGSRGTCSIFSTAGMVESLLKISTATDYDLNENYLEYLVMTKVKTYASEGSDVQWNIPAMRDYGAIHETAWPYETFDWAKREELPATEVSRSDVMCNGLSGNDHEACLISHLRPDSDPHAARAQQLRADLRLNLLATWNLNQQKDIKAYLASNHALVLGLEFFYGAWNHRKMLEYGIGDRDMAKWDNGEVTTPTDRDIELSRQHPAGHSILIVGYDDSKRVYYFKNSWGQAGFGMNSWLVGRDGFNTAGYGSISYDYANRFGSFVLVQFRKQQ